MSRKTHTGIINLMYNVSIWQMQSFGMRILVSGMLILSVLIQASNAQNIRGGKKISNELFGLFFEDINYFADGGLYAEMVQNRSFEYSPAEHRGWTPFSYWDYLSPGFSIGRISAETKEHVHITLQRTKGEVIAGETVAILTNKWQKYTTSPSATANSDNAALVIPAKNEGKLALDMISLFPVNTFKDRHNGLRADLSQLPADLKPKFVRFPGGCLVHGKGIGNMYRWKNTIGPVEQSKAQLNTWGYHQTGGLGVFEYFQFCADIGAKPVPILPAAVSCQNSGGTHVIGGAGQKTICMDDMDEYIQEVLGIIEWANGSSTSGWGAKRAAAGHPEPFNIEHAGIGIEDKITPEFAERFTMIFQAVKEKHPEIKSIGTSGPFSDGEDFEKGWELCNKLQVGVIDEHYYKGPDWFLGNHNRYDKYKRKEPKVYLEEYASCVVDSQTGDVIHRLVNIGSGTKSMNADLSRFRNKGTSALQTILAGMLSDENTFEDPDRGKPVESEITIRKKFDYLAPPMSLTVIRIKTT